MIIGECPYEGCKGPVFLHLQEGRPIQRHTCVDCKRHIWTLHSRFEPKSWTEEAFNLQFIVDEETKTIRERPNP